MASSPGVMRAPRWRFIGLYIAGWSGITLAFAAQYYTLDSLEKLDTSFLQALAWAFNSWMTWALVAPFVLVVARRWPLAAESWERRLPIHLVAMVVAVTLHVLVYVTLHEWTYTRSGTETWAATFAFFYLKNATLDCMVYWGLVGLSHATAYYRLYREREVAASRLEARLARSQLQTLRTQLHPHFFFNTLNTISSLMRRDVEDANRVVSRLGDLLRLSLQHSERQETTLRQELEFLEHYLVIQRIRFEDRLEITVSAPEETLDALVPSLVLQPLVENAIRYAIEPRTTPGRVTVTARLDERRLVLEVGDDGPGMAAEARAAFTGNGKAHEYNGCGIGLANTRARLEQLYGRDQRFELSARQPSGLLVRIEVPFRLGPLPTPVALP